MEIMKKLWIYKRKSVKGWWCGWYENGKRKAKALPTKTLAEHFRHIKDAQLNSDVFTSLIDFDWRQILEEYKRHKRVEGLDEASIYEVVLTLRHYERLAGPNSSKDITQQNLDTFVPKRSGEVKKNTLNKDIKNLHAFLKWAAQNRFVAPDLKVKKVKVAQKPVTSLSSQRDSLQSMFLGWEWAFLFRNSCPRPSGCPLELHRFSKGRRSVGRA